MTVVPLWHVSIKKEWVCRGRGESTRGVWVIVTNNLSVDCRGKMWSRPDPLPWGAQVRFTFAFESYKTGQELKQTVFMIDYECLLLFY